MSDTFDPDERFSVPEGTEPDDVLRKLLEPDGAEGVSNEPEDQPQEG